MLVTVMYLIALAIISKLNPAQFGEASAVQVTWRDRLAGLRLLWPFSVTGLVVVGGIFGGVFSPNKAAAIATVVVLGIVVFTGGKRRWHHVGTGLMEAVADTGMIFLLLGGAAMFSRFIALTGIADWVLNAIVNSGLSQLGIIAGIIIVYLIAGCFMDCVSAMLISVPVFYPALLAAGIDPIWFGMITILGLEMGVITPPVGMNVYGVSAVAEPDVTLQDVFAGAMPFFFVDLAALAIVVFVPEVSTYLPSLMAR